MMIISFTILNKMKDNLFVNATIKDGKLHFPIKAQENRYIKFLSQFPNDTRIELFVGANNGKGSVAQLAYIHSMCREIANEIGYTFEEIKLQVKRKAGICFIKDGTEYCKSFSQCDKSELNMVIQTCLEIADFNGIQLR